MSSNLWACPRCQSPFKQADCCGTTVLWRDGEQVPFQINRKTCEHSTFRTNDITKMMEHMVRKHGMKAPPGYEEELKRKRQQEKNKKKRQKQKKKDRKKNRRKGRR